MVDPCRALFEGETSAPTRPTGGTLDFAPEHQLLVFDAQWRLRERTCEETIQQSGAAVPIPGGLLLEPEEGCTMRWPGLSSEKEVRCVALRAQSEEVTILFADGSKQVQRFSGPFDVCPRCARSALGDSRCAFMDFPLDQDRSCEVSRRREFLCVESQGQGGPACDASVVDGAPCDPDVQAGCSIPSSTCGISCEACVDGIFRWQLWCTE